MYCCYKSELIQIGVATKKLLSVESAIRMSDRDQRVVKKPTTRGLIHFFFKNQLYSRMGDINTFNIHKKLDQFLLSKGVLGLVL